MPYNSTSDLPEAAKKLSPKKQKQFLAVFNDAYERALKEGKSKDEAESSAFAQAWAAVKKFEEGDVPDAPKLEMVMTPFTFTMPIVKVDKEKREVYGLATAEALDTTGEVLAFDGSVVAFSDWVGNVREMHQPKAVGKGITVEVDEAEKAIYVKSKISKGAQDTWEKVLDGTLSFYSVGGSRVKTAMVKSADVPAHVWRTLKKDESIPEKIRWTDKWRMVELSLVDSGAMPIARIELVKSVDGVPTMTDVVGENAEAAVAEVEKKTLSASERNSLPDSSFAYIEPGGKTENGKTTPNHLRHYPIKNAQGECDATHVRNALARASAAMQGSGKSAEIAKKAMPKIKACAKKLKMGKLNEDPFLFACANKITRILMKDGTEYAADEIGSPQDVVALVKQGECAYGCAYEPCDFETAYDNWRAQQEQYFPYDVANLLYYVLCNILVDPNLSNDEKKKLVAQSTDQFVTIYFEAVQSETATEAEASEKEAAVVTVAPDKGQGAAEMAENAEVKKEEKPVETKPAESLEKTPAFDPTAFSKMIQDGFASAAKSSEAIQKSVDEMKTDLTKVTERVTKLEETPVEKPGLVLKAIEKGTETVPVRGGAGSADLQWTENGVTYKKSEIEKRQSEIASELSKMPLDVIDRRRDTLEVEYVKLNRIHKILSGDQVWDLRRR